MDVGRKPRSSRRGRDIISQGYQTFWLAEEQASRTFLCLMKYWEKSPLSLKKIICYPDVTGNAIFDNICVSPRSILDLQLQNVPMHRSVPITTTTLRVRIPLGRGVIYATLCDKVRQWRIGRSAVFSGHSSFLHH